MLVTKTPAIFVEFGGAVQFAKLLHSTVGDKIF